MPAPALPSSNADGLDLTERYLSANRAAAFRAFGLTMVQGRREGVRIWDLDGNSYINCRSSGGVFNYGHRPQFMVDALKAALDEHDMGDWLLPSARRAQAAETLARILPGDLHYSFFTASGAEANEVACKLARGVTGRPGFVCLEAGYHGHIGTPLAMDDEHYAKWYGPLVPGVRRVPIGDADAIDRAVDDTTAAVCMETIPATAGYLVPPDDYFDRVRRICDDRGALLILDEIQSGLGRTGRIWACEHWGVVPDLLTTGKGLGGAVYPIAACCYGDRVEAFLANDPLFHPSSFGGSELGAAVVEAVIDTLTEPGFLDHVNAMSDRFIAGFERLCERYPEQLTGWCGKGLMLALETPSEELGFALMRGAIENGVLAIYANNRRRALLVMPPLVISADEVDEVLAGLHAATAAMAQNRVGG